MVVEDTNAIVTRQCIMLSFLFILFLSTQPGYYHGRYGPHHNPFDWFEFERSLDDNLFYNSHRMDKPSFYKLCGKISPLLRNKYERTNRVRLSFESMLSLTLSYLGGARICDLRVLCRPINKKVIFSYMWNVIDAINETFAFSFPLDRCALIDIENGFRSRSRKQVLKGCLGAIDGTRIPMTCPGKRIPNSDRYFVQRKNKFAMLCIACCDSNRIFTFFDCSKCSRSHDSMAFCGTKVRMCCISVHVISINMQCVSL